MSRFTKSYSNNLFAFNPCSIRSLRLHAFIVSLLLLISGGAISQSANLDQGENGKSTSRTSPVTWINGNLNLNNAHLAEGYSIPYRCRISGLVGTSTTEHKLVIEWDTKDQNGHAIDYITYFQNYDNPAGSHQFNYNHAPETVTPTSGTAFSGAPSLIQIEKPSSAGAEVLNMPGDSFDDLPANTGNTNATKMAIWGGSIKSMAYLNEDPQDATTASTKTRLEITFTSANGSTALIAWGGHIAAEYDWGTGRGASKVSGSPYHMRIIAIDGKPGNQDRSLKANVVLVPTVGCTISAAQTACEGSSTALTYSYTGTATGITNYSWTLSPGSTNATIQNGTTTTTLSGASVTSITIVPGSGKTYATGSFSVSLTLTNLGGAGTPCTQTGTVNSAPTVNAGDDATVCASNPAVTLGGSVAGGATSGTWTTGGDGTFDDATKLNAVYTPGDADIAAGKVTLTLTTNDPTGPCEAVHDDMVINITTNPTRPEVQYIAPECNQSTFSVKIIGAATGGSYTLTQDPGGVGPVTKTTTADADGEGNILFSNLTVGKGFSIILTVGDCSSDATNCDNYKPAPLTQAGTNKSQSIETVNAKIDPKQSKVLAAPNPFSSRIRFSLESAISGQGSLELFNMLGQKVKTVYQGYVKEGQTLNVEYSVPIAQRANLMYVFRVGNQQVTGKLISIK